MAQTQELFLKPGVKVEKITNEQRARVEKIKQRATTGEISLVKVDPSSLDKERIAISLPHLGSRTFLKVAGERTAGSNGIVWSGEGRANDEKATMVVNRGKVTGSVWVGPTLFRIEPIGGDLHALITVAQVGFPQEHPAPR